MEGGGMRGLYTAGVIDVLMENEIYADSAVGVSAGAVFGCNYKSRQIGRVLRYNKKYCKDKRLASIRNWITTGDVYSREFGYYELPWKLDIFDRQTYAENPMKFTVVCTDLDTGKPVYTLATALSLLVFYALSMQCMSTLAVVRRETGSWKWAIFQFVFMGALAYLCAWLVYAFFA